MRIAGIIAEFNPFHNGHASLVNMARHAGAEYIVAVMSGNFVQRGEPAIFSFRERAKVAIENGVDLVIQLPVAFSVAGAETFARGGVGILDATGIVDTLVFASESGDIQQLIKTSKIVSSQDVDEKLVENLKSGITYAAARENAVRSVSNEAADLLKMPNNILGIQYLCEIDKLKSNMNAVTFMRCGASHDSNDISGDIASASEIRRRIDSREEWSDFVPKNSFAHSHSVSVEKYEAVALYKMRTITKDELLKLPDISEGIENRIISAAQKAETLTELYEMVKTKRYTMARIRRIVLCAVLGITTDDIINGIQYIKIAGMNAKGRELLKIMEEKSSLPVVTKPKDFGKLGLNAERMFALENTAGKVYSVCNSDVGPDDEKMPIIVK